MKKFLLITIISVGFHIYTIGQNWDLFPKNKYLMFELLFNNQNSFIERIVKDSTKVNNDSTISYFNSKWINNAKCSSAIINNKDLEDGYLNSYLQLDLSVEKRGWHYFNCSDFSGCILFKFNGLAKVNDTWFISEDIAFKCDSVSQRLIFGQLDSVKYFSNTKVAITFVLSKNFGLIEFAPFGQLIYSNSFDISKVKLIGIENNEYKMGSVIPEFKDFFHLNKGDVVFWNYYYEPWDIREPIIDYYYKDSITKSIITEDSVIYEINSIRGGSITKDKQSYYKNKLVNFLKPNTSLGFFSDDSPCGFFADNLLYWQCSNISKDSNYFSLSYNWSSLLLDTTNCTLDRVYDAGSYFSLNTKVGLSSCNERTVVGAIINGEKWGITNIPTGISETTNSIVRFYPNPCYDKLFIQLNNSENTNYKLFNIKGQLIKFGQVNADYIDLSDLQSGYYDLKINKGKIQVTERIIKINNR